MTKKTQAKSIAHTAGQVPLGGFRGFYYAGSYVYEDGNLQYQLFSEGRKLYNSDDNTWQYEYHLKDHLGNVRVVFEPERYGSERENTITQENHYYPFGLRISDLGLQNSENKYLYNGKEIDTEFDLNWYHYGFRMYDPVIGRFPSLDPKADEFAWVSPYNYAENSPIANIDLWGLQANLVIYGERVLGGEPKNLFQDVQKR